MFFAKQSDHLSVDNHFKTLSVELVLLETSLQNGINLGEVVLQFAFRNLEIGLPASAFLNKLFVVDLKHLIQFVSHPFGFLHKLSVFGDLLLLLLVRS